MNAISPRAKSSCDIEVNLVRSKNRVAIAAVMQPKSKNWTLRAQRMMTAEFWVVTTTNDVNQEKGGHTSIILFRL